VIDRASVLLAFASAERLVDAPIQELLEQFSLEKLEPFAGLADGSEIRGQFLCAVASEDLRQFPVARLECGQRRQSGTAEVLKGIVSHASFSDHWQHFQFVPFGFHSRDTYVNGPWQCVGGLGLSESNRSIKSFVRPSVGERA